MQDSQQSLSDERIYFFDNSVDLFCVAGFDGFFKVLNRMWTEVLGYSTEELLQAPYASFIHPEDVAATEAEAGKIAQGVVTISFENRYRCKDGRYIWLLWTANADIEKQLIYAVARDITDRKQMFLTQLELSEQKFHTLLESAAIGIFIVNHSGVIHLANQMTEKLFGYARSEMVGQPIEMLIPQKLTAVHEAHRRQYVTNPPPGIMAINRAPQGQHKNGTIFSVEVTLNATQFGEETLYMAFVADITARKKAEQGLQESRERYMLATKGANDGLWDWNLITDELFVSERWLEMVGLKGDDGLYGPSDIWMDRIRQDDLEQLETKLQAHINGLLPHFEHEYQIKHANGEFRWMISRGIAIRNQYGVAERIAGSQRDITRRKKMEQELFRNAFYDLLTGLPNRRHFIERLYSAVEFSKNRPHFQFAVYFIDLDRFKYINDSLGHALGDQFLMAVSEMFQSCIEPHGKQFLARLGGDEFSILWTEYPNMKAVQEFAERLQLVLSRPFRLAGYELFTSASIGIAVNDRPYHSPSEVLRDADTAMYNAKALGKGRAITFQTDHRIHVMSNWQMSNDLHHALKHQEIEVFYQPIASLKSGKIMRLESLVRWNHPVHGLLTPKDFVPLADSIGLLPPIGMFVLHESCRQLAVWREEFPELQINVNMSAHELQQADFSTQVEAAITAASLPATVLEIEITEGVAVALNVEAERALHQLIKLGVRVGIDDFGIGSSLECLQRFPLSTLKIDQSFIQDLVVKKENKHIVASLITLAHQLELSVVAEGVEQESQRQFLVTHGCDEIQGYLIGRPVNAAEMSRLLLEKR